MLQNHLRQFNLLIQPFIFVAIACNEETHLMSYQTSLNFAPAVPVRRNKPTPKQSRGVSGSKSKQTPSVRPSSPEPEYDDGGNDDNRRSAANHGPRGPSQLDALTYSDSDEDNVAMRGSKLKERRRAAAAKLRRRKAGKRKSNSSFLEDTDDEDDDEAETKRAPNEFSTKKNKRLGGSNKKKKRQVIEDDAEDIGNFIVDDDSSAQDDENGSDLEEEEEVIIPIKKKKARAADDGSSDEEPMSHAALAFQMQLDQQAAKQDEELLAEMMMANRSLSEDEAFQIWLEDLALQAEAYLKSNAGKKKGHVHVSTLRQQKAASQIERPLCTRRESTLGSSAWRPEFRDELKHRPLYRSFELNQLAVPDDVKKCGACGRGSDHITHRIEFSGPRYNADRTWQSSRDLKHADWEACLRPMGKDQDLGDDEDSKPTTFYVGGHCRARTELYHSLLHFKFMAFDEILGLLSGDHSNVAIRMQLKANGQVLDQFLSKTKKGGKKDAGEAGEGSVHRPISVEELMSNGGFLERQHERCRNLTEESEEKWGGHKGEMTKGLSGQIMPRKRKDGGQVSLLKMLGGGGGGGGGGEMKGNSAKRKHQSTLNFSPKK